MTHSNNSHRRLALTSSVATLAFALLAGPALAQTATAAAETEAADESTIVVTGTLIRNPNLVSAVPIVTTTADTIALRGSNVAEEVLREIPGIVPNIGSAVNNGNGGASFVDLRGLGANRNLVLLDGQRIAPAGLAGTVDLNNIPLALVERVDALTGAAVTTYGADAITGVVNFVTKKNFTGMDLQVSNSLTERGDGHRLRADLTIGGDFADGKGNAVISLGYQKADPVFQGDRDISITGITTANGAPGGSPTGVPSRIRNVRPIDPLTGQPSTNPAVANLGNGQLSPDGRTAIPFYQPFNFNPFNVFQGPFQRFNIFAKANYQITDNIEVYGRGMFSKNTVRTIIAPSGLFSQTVDLPLSNPFLPAAIRNQYCAFNTSSVASGLYTPRFTPGECNAAATALSPTDPNYRSVTTLLSRRTVEAGTRDSEYTTTVFDYTAGLRGKLTNTIDWDVSASYGESENLERTTGYLINDRVLEAILATNTTTCLSGNAACVPLNLYGPAGSITPAMARFISADASTRRTTSLTQVRALLSGDFGFGFGDAEPVAFAVGAEYRDYGAAVLPDDFTERGALGGGGGPTPRVEGGYNVKEIYGEIIAPILEGKPFFENLTFEAGARYSAYEVAAPGNPSFDAFTWKAGGTWEFTPGFKVRGNYSRAVRAPNIGELFSPVSRGLTNLGTDPCAGAAPVGNANLTAICIAQGASASVIGQIDQPAAGQANAYGGGNPNARPEKASTWTLGAVFQPTFAPGLAITADYYNISVTDAITSPLPGDAIGACFGTITAASAASAACTSIRRDPLSGSFDGESLGLPRPLSNLGRLKTDGLDVNVTYSTDLGFAKLGVSGNFNYTFRAQFQATPTSVNRECVGFYSPNCSFTGSIQPKWQTTLRTTLGFDSFDVSMLWRHIDNVIQEPLNAAAPTAANGFFGDDSPFFPAFQQIRAYDYFDLTGRFKIGDKLTLITTVSNLFDTKPPLIGSEAGATAFNSGNTFPSTYDTLGRRYTVQLNVRF
ncbi:TonB-dependent receptor domain-containing protein [Sandarakinorhabdus sp.]|uniref:TonB-dependent receptor domain-containing protein n=1 Tax=Sandarakinorhabdus sp. TaxID=1916663 RepID=UPI00286E8E4E|nr:TonB-dependent receptor [Sandarakinorhabdus sp.]